MHLPSYVVSISLQGSDCMNRMTIKNSFSSYERHSRSRSPPCRLLFLVVQFISLGAVKDILRRSLLCPRRGRARDLPRVFEDYKGCRAMRRSFSTDPSDQSVSGFS